MNESFVCKLFFEIFVFVTETNFKYKVLDKKIVNFMSKFLIKMEDFSRFSIIFFLGGYEDSTIELWIFFEKINRVSPMNFDQFCKIFKILEPNGNLAFFEIWAFLTYFSSRVRQIFVLNYQIFVPKKSKFLLFSISNSFSQTIIEQISLCLGES